MERRTWHNKNALQIEPFKKPFFLLAFVLLPKGYTMIAENLEKLVDLNEQKKNRANS